MMPDQPNDFERLVAVAHHHRQFSTDADLVRALLLKLARQNQGKTHSVMVVTGHLIRQGEPDAGPD